MRRSKPQGPKVSLIVALRNEGVFGERCLASVAWQQFPSDQLEVIVVDGMSDDGTRQVAERFIAGRPGWKLLENPERTLIPGLNAGVSAAAGEFIGYVNGHTELPVDYVARMIETLSLHDAWSVGARYERVGLAPTQLALARVMSHPLGVGGGQHNYGTQPGPAESVFPGFWPRWVFERIGMFDPRMLSNEDNEFSERIRAAGGTVWYEPSVSVRYYPRSTLRAAFVQFFGYGRGKARVFAKHPHSRRFRHVVPAAWVSFVVAGGMASVVVAPARPLYMAGWAAYLAVIGAAATLSAGGRPSRIIRTTGAFLAVHAGYGTGLLRGLFAGDKKP